MRAGHSSTLLPMINPGPIDSNRDSLRAGSDSAPVQPGPQAAFVEPLPQCGSPWLDTLLSLRVDGGRPLGAAADPDAFALSSSRQAHEAPAFRFARDAHAGAYVDFAQTREMTAYLARRVRTPDRIVSACGAKSRLWALELLQAGIPKDALRVVAMFVPDVSPQGLERAHATGGDHVCAIAFHRYSVCRATATRLGDRGARRRKRFGLQGGAIRIRVLAYERWPARGTYRLALGGAATRRFAIQQSLCDSGHDPTSDSRRDRADGHRPCSRSHSSAVAD